MSKERSAAITIGGKEYDLVLTTRATKEIAGRYGGLENLGDRLMKYENFEMALDEIIWIIALWFHLRHGFWSAFQTIGLDNQIWIKRWKCVAKVYAFIVAVGFISIPVAVLLITCCGK